jgi:predicted HicB family RNase H-like nuclease
MKELKTFTIRVEGKLWEFFKMQTIKQNKSLNELINEAMKEFKKKVDKKS